jgi:hypothetical protein
VVAFPHVSYLNILYSGGGGECVKWAVLRVVKDARTCIKN